MKIKHRNRKNEIKIECSLFTGELQLLAFQKVQKFRIVFGQVNIQCRHLFTD